MDIVAQEKKQNKRYLPHDLTTRIGAVNLCRQTHDIDFVVRRYHVSKASLMRWNKRYDGTRGSLMDKSAQSASQCPYRGGTEVDSGLPSADAEYQHL